MRVVLQRASSGSVTVDGAIVGALPHPGLVALVGVATDDGPAQVELLARKTWELRLLDDERSASEVDAPILAVSQFTLYADTRKGRRPSWNKAAPGPIAEPLFDSFVENLRQRGAHVETGVFGADMTVQIVNEGPLTIILDSDELQPGTSR